MQITVNGQLLTVADDTLVSNSVGIYECEFTFDSSWDGFSKTSVWKLNSDDPIEVVISNGKAVIPHEVLENAGFLRIGVYGTKDEKVMPTVWLEKRKVCLGTPTGSIGTEPTPSIYAQILEVANEAKEIAEDVQTEWESVSATAETLPSGSSATASFDGEVFSFGIPQGEKGDRGEDGDTPTFTVTPIVTPTYSGNRITIEIDGSVTIFDVKNGTNGAKGEDGVGITDIELTSDYRLEITLSDGTVITTPSIRGEQGETGNGIASITKTATVGKVDTYTITYTDGTTTTFDVTNGEVSEAELEEALIDKADVITNTASGTIASFSDGAEMPVKSLEVEINAVQDLHGQANPYPAGGGVNQWDEEWELGSINFSTGAKQNSSVNIRSKNYISVVGGETYYGKAGTLSSSSCVVFFYAEDKTYISNSYCGNTSFTAPADAKYALFYCGSTYGTTYKNDISINYPSTDTSYHPYENICPISGWNAVNVVRTGRNLLETTLTSQTRNGITYTVNSDGTIQVQGTASALSIVNIGSYVVREDATYYASGCPSGGSASTYRMYCSWGSNEIGNGSQRELTAGTTVTLQIAIASGITINATYKPMFCKLSDGTAYEPYNGTTYPISLGQTVYGGVLDVTSGVLTVTHGIKVWDGTENFGLVSDGTTNRRFTVVLSGTTANGICSHGVMVNTNSGSWGQFRLYTTGNFAVLDNGSNFADATALKAYLAEQYANGTPLTVVYELATPITITLTPTEVTTLLGDNNIWADSGDVAVIYRADTKAYIDGTIVDVPLAMIAPIETGTKSSKAYAVGEYFILNGNQFCKAKTAIASGATFTLNTNYTVTTIGAELKALA